MTSSREMIFLLSAKYDPTTVSPTKFKNNCDTIEKHLAGIQNQIEEANERIANLQKDRSKTLPSDARANDNMYAAFDNLEARSGKPCYDQVVGKQRKDIIEGLVKRGKDMTKRLNNLRSEEGRMKKAQNGTVEKENERPADDDVGWTTVIKKRPSRGT